MHATQPGRNQLLHLRARQRAPCRPGTCSLAFEAPPRHQPLCTTHLSCCSASRAPKPRLGLSESTLTERRKPAPLRWKLLPRAEGVLLLLAVVATLAAGMVWQQQRAIAVEAAELMEPFRWLECAESRTLTALPWR